MDHKNLTLLFCQDAFEKRVCDDFSDEWRACRQLKYHCQLLDHDEIEDDPNRAVRAL